MEKRINFNRHAFLHCTTNYSNTPFIKFLNQIIGEGGGGGVHSSHRVRPITFNHLPTDTTSSPIINHAPTLGSPTPTRICANCPGSVVVPAAAAVVVFHGAIPGPPGPALTDPAVSSFDSLLDPYGLGNEFWRCRPCVTMWPGTVTPDSAAPGCCAAAAAMVGEECAFVMPGTEMKYTEPVGSVPP